MTGVTITFVSSSKINIANATGGTVVFQISKLLTTGVFDTAVTKSINNGQNSDHDFGSTMGIYKIYNPTALDANTVIITPTILTELEEDVKQLLLADDIKKELPKAYDFVTLAVLSIGFIGNSPYQNVLYSAGNMANYTTIATAIDRTIKYFDRQNNTPQSTNKIWQ